MSGTDEQLSAHEVRRRAVVDVLRGSGIRLVGLLGTVITARLLTPYDFGLVAVGTTVFAFGSSLDDGGVGTALIRRPEPPTKSELRAMVAFQFGIDLTLLVGIGLVMLLFGLLLQVTTRLSSRCPLTAPARRRRALVESIRSAKRGAWPRGRTPTVADESIRTP